MSEAKQNTMMRNVVRLLSEHLPSTVPYARHCQKTRDRLRHYSENELLFHTITSLCREEDIFIPDNLYVLALRSRFKDLSLDLATVIVTRHGFHFRERKKILKFRDVVVAVANHKFRSTLAVAKRTLMSITNIPDLSERVQELYYRKIDETNTINTRLRLSEVDPSVYCNEILALIVRDSESLLTPLESYPDRCLQQHKDEVVVVISSPQNNRLEDLALADSFFVKDDYITRA